MKYAIYPCHCFVVLYFLAMTLSHITHAQSLTTNMQVTGLEHKNKTAACEGSEIMFTCTITTINEGDRPTFLIWRSYTYIGPGTNDQLDIGNDTIQRSSNILDQNGTAIAHAVLIHNSASNMLKSTLKIVVRNEPYEQFVECQSGDDLRSHTRMDFNVLARPGPPQNLIAVQILHQPDMCFVSMLWLVPDNANISAIINYTINANDEISVPEKLVDHYIRTQIWITTLLLVPACKNHTVSVYASNDCYNTGERSVEVILNREDILVIPESVISAPLTSTVGYYLTTTVHTDTSTTSSHSTSTSESGCATTVTNDNSTYKTQESRSSLVGVSAFLGVVLVIFILAVLLVLLILFLLKQKGIIQCAWKHEAEPFPPDDKKTAGGGHLEMEQHSVDQKAKT